MLGLALGTVAAFALTASFASGAAISTIPTRSTVVPRSAVTARAAVIASAATAMPATVAAIATRAPVTALARLARGTGVGQLLAGFLVDEAHREAHLAALVDLEQLDLHFLTLGEDVADVLDPLVLDLRDVNQSVLAGHEGHERAEIDDACH